MSTFTEAFEAEKNQQVLDEFKSQIVQPMGYTATGHAEDAHESMQNSLGKATHKAQYLVDAATSACNSCSADAPSLRDHVAQGDQLWRDVAAGILYIEHLVDSMCQETALFGKLYQDLGQSLEKIQGIADEFADTTAKLETVKTLAAQHQSRAKKVAETCEHLRGATAYIRDDGKYLVDLLAATTASHARGG